MLRVLFYPVNFEVNKLFFVNIICQFSDCLTFTEVILKSKFY